MSRQDMRPARMDAWGARQSAEHAAWGRYLDSRLNDPDMEPDVGDPGHAVWHRYMRRDCLHLASAIATRMRLPVGRLMKSGQLAHAFVILPNLDGVPDRWPCLDWSGVRTLKRIRDDLREGWGRLVFDDDLSTIDFSAKDMQAARTRPHIAQAIRLDWPRVSTASLHRGRLRYLNVIDCGIPRRPGRPRLPDVIRID